MNDLAFQELVATAARRELTPAEKAQLEVLLERHPDLRTDWELDGRLSRTLRRLPDIPVPSNFTARVLRGVEQAVPRHRPHLVPGWLRWVRRTGHGWQVAAACGAIALVATVQVRQTRQNTELAHSLAAIPVNSFADLELWRDFEQINALPNGPLPSVDQLAEALK